MDVQMFCGGLAETNGYLLIHEKKGLLIDAPEGMADWAEEHASQSKTTLVGLLITHGHWDHIVDAVKIHKRLKIPMWIHEDSAILLETPSIQAPFNPYYQLEPCKADRHLGKESQAELDGFLFNLLFCPGHCPGSLCFHFPEKKWLFGGDVLFAGSVGRWDLPGGSQKELLGNIRSKLLVLPDDTEVFPGHGPTTTIGEERRTNAYIR
jgi:hydroxyacylglutathione hydrolase